MQHQLWFSGFLEFNLIKSTCHSITGTHMFSYCTFHLLSFSFTHQLYTVNLEIYLLSSLFFQKKICLFSLLQIFCAFSVYAFSCLGAYLCNLL